jgi:hypothetical protein
MSKRNVVLASRNALIVDLFQVGEGVGHRKLNVAEAAVSISDEAFDVAGWVSEQASGLTVIVDGKGKCK